MLSSYAQEDGIEQAIRQTFSGERPCELCKVIQANETDKQPIAPNQTDSKQRDFQLLLVNVDAFALLDNATSPKPHPVHAAAVTSRSGEVPVPPPRA